MSIWLYAGLFVAVPGTALAGVYYYYNVFRIHALKRVEFIRGYQWPRGLYGKILEQRPTLTRKELALISRGLRQYFLA